MRHVEIQTVRSIVHIRGLHGARSIRRARKGTNLVVERSGPIVADKAAWPSLAASSCWTNQSNEDVLREESHAIVDRDSG
jgi:hypothetical protein